MLQPSTPASEIEADPLPVALPDGSEDSQLVSLTPEEIALNGRIMEFLRICKIKDKHFAQAIGMSGGVVYLVKHNKQAASAKFLLSMLRVYHDLRAEWLLRNEGEMLRDDTLVVEEPKGIYLLSASSQIETLKQLADSQQKQIKDLEVKLIHYKEKAAGKA
jgi:hypothetical protein